MLWRKNKLFFHFRSFFKAPFTFLERQIMRLFLHRYNYFVLTHPWIMQIYNIFYNSVPIRGNIFTTERRDFVHAFTGTFKCFHETRSVVWKFTRFAKHVVIQCQFIFELCFTIAFDDKKWKEMFLKYHCKADVCALASSLKKHQAKNTVIRK